MPRTEAESSIEQAFYFLNVPQRYEDETCYSGEVVAVFIWNVSPRSVCILLLSKTVMFKSHKNIEVLKDLLKNVLASYCFSQPFSFCWENILLYKCMCRL